MKTQFKSFAITTGLGLMLAAPIAQADCVKRVGQAQAAIERLLAEQGSTPLRGEADIELTVLLLDLCREAAVGSTNVHTQDKEITTTRNLNPKSEIEEEGNKTTLFGLEVEPKGSDARFKRPGKK